MKITETELESNLLNKINQLDNAKTNATSTASYISYNGTEFVSKQFNELNLHKIFSTDEIYNLSSHLYHSENNYHSAYDSIMTTADKSYAASALMTTLKGSFAFKIESEIVKIKTYGQYIFALCTNGYMYKIDRNNTSIQTKKDVLTIIKTNFVYQNFDIYSIVDFDTYSDGVLLATELNGIFFISMDRNESANVVQELYINHIKVLSDRKTLLITKYSDKSNIILFNLETGNKLGSYNQLGIDHQTALSIDVGENEFYILGRTSSVNQDNDLLHYWKLDAAGVNYENYDRIIAANPCDNSYRPKLVKTDKSNVYVIGVKDKSMFMWEYSKENLNTSPIELSFNLQDFKYDDITDFVNINNKYYITLKNQILVLDKNFTLLENYLLNAKTSNFKSAKITAGGIYAVYDKECYSFFIPEKTYQKTVDVTITNETCNNIDVMVKANSGNTINFYNADTGEKVTPYFYMKMDDRFHIIKLLNISVKNILMRIGTIGETEKIYGVVVHKNRIFTK